MAQPGRTLRAGGAGAYTRCVTRTVLILGLIALAAFLPLVMVPLPVVTVAPRVFAIAPPAPFVTPHAQPVSLLALALFRAPPSAA
jgi:hypothetical protein